MMQCLTKYRFVASIVSDRLCVKTYRFESPNMTNASTVRARRARQAQRVNLVDSGYAWARLSICLLLSTVGGAGLWVGVVTLPKIQADFGVDRADAALAYTACMIGFGVGGVLAGRLVDRFGAFVPVFFAAFCIGIGFFLAALSANIWQLTIVNLLIGIGASATFAPLMADISQWFVKRRGTAIAICASGNYLAGVIWPMIMQQLLVIGNWRQGYLVIGVACFVLMLPLTVILITRSPSEREQARAARISGHTQVRHESTMPPWMVQGVLVLAGLACCIAMSMPQVHIVAYCVDLNFGVARGAEMLSLMLATGVISRLASGIIADKIGGVRTLLLGSVLQMATLALYVPFDGLASLYVVSALFGLSQGGIVPSYAIVIREYFPAHEAATRVSIVLMATIFGMSLGGWLSGIIFDVTGSYQAAFVHGVGWNLLNIALMLMLMWRVRRPNRVIVT